MQFVFPYLPDPTVLLLNHDLLYWYKTKHRTLHVHGDQDIHLISKFRPTLQHLCLTKIKKLTLPSISQLRSIKLVKCSINDQQFEQFITHCQHLQKITIYGCFKISHYSAKQMTALPITHLTISMCHDIQNINFIEQLHLQSLTLAYGHQFMNIPSLQHLPLTNLNLKRCHTANPKTLYNLPNTLTHLNLQHCNKIKDHDLKQMVKSCQHIRTLFLDGLDKLKNLSYLSHFPLEHLSLAFCKSVYDLGQLGPALKTIRTLNLCHANYLYSTQPFDQMPNLTNLNLSYTTINSYSKIIHQLRKLHLSCNNFIFDNSSSYLRLQHLVLQHNNLTDDQLEEIVASFPMLQYLDIQDNPSISQSTIEYIKQTLDLHTFKYTVPKSRQSPPTTIIEPEPVRSWICLIL